MKKILRNNNINDKINEILDRYLKIASENNFKTKDIMILVPNNNIKNMYEEKLNLEFSEELKITTYINFIKKEIIKYWPLINEECKEIKRDVIVPIFISNNLSNYIINNQVKNMRDKEGYFQELISTNRNISNNISSNINKAALSLIDFSLIGEKIYYSKKNKDNINRFAYSEMNEIIDYYIHLLLSNGLLDNSICIYLYNNYLIKNKLYLNSIRDEINYLFIDSLETCSIAEIGFIDTLKDNLKELYINFDNKKDYSVFNNVDMVYINNFIKENFDQYIDNSIDIKDIYSIQSNIDLNESSQLYSEMIEQISDKIKELINENKSLKDIVIISPVNNTILDYQLKKLLEKHNILVSNIKKDKKLIDYPYGNALVVASCLLYGYEDILKEEEYINFIEIVLNVNRFRAVKIFKSKDENEDYLELLKYIGNKRDKNLKISEFLVQFYIDKMLNLKYGKENLHICKKIIFESEIFVENIKLLELNNDEEEEKIFIEILRSTINDYYSNIEVKELNDSNCILVTTPYSYMYSNINRSIQIWVDIGSNSWNMKIEKDISNMIVLRQSFKENTIYTDAMEEYYKKYYLYNMIYNLLLNAKEVHAFKSDYTVNGYMQESILYSLILKILDKGDNNYE